MAENLASGQGYIGLYGERHTMFPPLLPFLILLVEPAVGSFETAARSVSFLCGLGLVWPAWVLGRSLGGRRAAFAAAILVATHGVAVGFSAATYVEGPFFFFLFGAAAILSESFEKPARIRSLLAGIMFGLAFLLRPEAFAYCFLGIVLTFYAGWRHRMALTQIFSRIGILLCGFLILALPYVAWLSEESGYFRIEGKSALNVAIAKSMENGLGFEMASRGITDRAEPEGAYLKDQSGLVPRPAKSGLFQSLENVFDSTVPRAVGIISKWSTDSGNVALGIFALAGLFAAVVKQYRQPASLLFLGMSAGYIAILLSIGHSNWFRYLYPIGFFAMIWAAVGIKEILTAFDNKITSIGTSIVVRRWVMSASAIFVISIVAVSSWPVRYGPVFFESHSNWAQALGETGRWIREEFVDRPVVMTMSAVIPYYAGGTLSYLPSVASGQTDLVLEYVESISPDVVVLRRAEVGANPYIESWLANGEIGDCGKEIHRIMESAENEIVVFKWQCQ